MNSPGWSETEPGVDECGKKSRLRENVRKCSILYFRRKETIKKEILQGATDCHVVPPRNDVALSNFSVSQ